MMRMCNEQSRDSELYTEAARATVREREEERRKKKELSQPTIHAAHTFFYISTNPDVMFWLVAMLFFLSMRHWPGGETPLGSRLVFGRNKACNNEHGEYTTYEHDKRMKQKSLIAIQRRFVNNATTCLISLPPINLWILVESNVWNVQ